VKDGHAEQSSADLLLGPYRVLDLTDERGLLCGRILGDLGADVWQVEPPGGSSARRQGPFHRDQASPERSLFWWAYAQNKRGITLDLETSAGQELLRRLVGGAHFLIESSDSGYLARLGLGYDDLRAISPALVMVSITAFGQDGPYVRYKDGELVGMSLGGMVYLNGDPDLPPVQIGVPQFYQHGSAAGAAGAMIAHHARQATGEGQHVDVSCQQAVVRSIGNAPASWDLEKAIFKRMGPYRAMSATTFMRTTWQCKDGFVNFQLSGGRAALPSIHALVAWMEESGMGDPAIHQVDWASLRYGNLTKEMMAVVEPPIQRFLLTRTKDELTRGALERRIFLFPVNSARDILETDHLHARNYFQQVEHPELGQSVTYPGGFVMTDRGRLAIRRRAPAIGEHNVEIYCGELGLTHAELAALKDAHVI